MISYDEKKRLFKLDTDNTTYLIRIYPSGHLGHLYYGKIIKEVVDPSNLEAAFKIEVGNQVIYD
ncbi:MAG: hypothetical protein PHI01_06290, partial [Candidatus Izemoplasmatales bacterium]|nr:hypothetical protein [Candidatus Izemoplasmatales bacterium]